jgi:hypothetical protein
LATLRPITRWILLKVAFLQLVFSAFSSWQWLAFLHASRIPKSNVQRIDHSAHPHAFKHKPPLEDGWRLTYRKQGKIMNFKSSGTITTLQVFSLLSYLAPPGRDNKLPTPPSPCTEPGKSLSSLYTITLPRDGPESKDRTTARSLSPTGLSN